MLQSTTFHCGVNCRYAVCTFCISSPSFCSSEANRSAPSIPQIQFSLPHLHILAPGLHSHSTTPARRTWKSPLLLEDWDPAHPSNTGSVPSSFLKSSQNNRESVLPLSFLKSSKNQCSSHSSLPHPYCLAIPMTLWTVPSLFTTTHPSRPCWKADCHQAHSCFHPGHHATLQ